jgi:hypothetical protein
MKRLIMMCAAILLSLPVVSIMVLKTSNSPALAATANASDSQEDANQTNGSMSKLDACSPPTQVSSSIDETAWRLLVAATCPVNQDRYPFVVWENWIEQEQMFPPDPANGLKVPNSGAQLTSTTHSLHASPLTLAENPGLFTLIPGLLGAADQSCTKAKAPPPNQPNLVICEEARMNGATEDYIAGRKLWNRGGQTQAALASTDIQFPAASLELKADWIQLSTIGVDCSNIPPGFSQSVHVETINGNCFALAGIAIMSKLLDNWIWATFEPQNLITNPNRCSVLGCTDTFGSTPARTRGANTQLTPRLSSLMEAANLSPEWKNYRLDGVQTRFTDGKNPTLLGNSIIEGENVGLLLTQSSCITCHAASSIKNDGTDGLHIFSNVPHPIFLGNPEPLPPEWIRRDFAWSLLLACPPDPSGAPQGRCNP